jgi:hypothetical protein
MAGGKLIGLIGESRRVGRGRSRFVLRTARAFIGRKAGIAADHRCDPGGVDA